MIETTPNKTTEAGAATAPAQSTPTTPAEHSFSFEELVKKERAWVSGGADNGDGIRVNMNAVTGEPWVCFSAHDTFGIALSGGGIRSATFNLGVLQTLERHRVLDKADYLSTVSGGGYVGGFLTAWRHHHPSNDASFPLQEETTCHTGPAAQPLPGANPMSSAMPSASVSDDREPTPIRHLREFSRFLMPRTGLLQAETWNAVVTILGGLLPSIVAACSVIMVVVGLWLALGYSMSKSPPYAGAALLVLITLGAMMYSEWRRRIASGRNAIRRNAAIAGSPPSAGAQTVELARRQEWHAFVFCGFAALVLLAATWTIFGYTLRPLANDVAARSGPAAGQVAIARVGTASQLADWVTNNFTLWSPDWVRLPAKDATFAPIGGAYAPAIAWFLVTIPLLAARVVYARWRALESDDTMHPNWSTTIDRVITICLVLALFWSVMSTLWLFAWLLNAAFEGRFGLLGAGIGGSAAGVAGLFAWLRDWLGKPSEKTRGSTLLEKAIQFLRPNIPQLLAIASVLLLVVLACLTLQHGVGAARTSGSGGVTITLLWTFGIAGFVILATLLTFDPARVGMHDFYRGRICRCYLGAARATQDNYSRVTSEQPGDDLKLGSVRPQDIKGNRRPHGTIHLVCCTANNLSGDVLGSLYRGGRSAVMSPIGLALGNDCAPLRDVRFSSVLTASAAAFNSQMGRRSVEFGPAVGFLMCALNLRLGLWVPHPLSSTHVERFTPGLPFFYEMFGWTNCDPPAMAAAATEPAAKPESRKMAERITATSRQLSRHLHHLHLSDGGHFENLALYELVRRHCRYIIASDCGADPDVVFDDLAIALRTIREDFGIEIDLDVSPLRRDAAGRARQHAVVGTIHYDGLGGLDKGTILYFKPALTGDEPPDVLQYQSRNYAFPHESTGDQFYDEAQWESYRRLGQHAAASALRFLDTAKTDRPVPQFVENVFLEATRLWQPAPEGRKETIAELTQRCADIETDIRENAPEFLRREFFPEPFGAITAGATQPTPAQETQALYFLMLVAQLMEEVWFAADLDTYWSHPLNDGWMNYFHRWASAPSFRRWWPVLRPIYSNGFRDFVRDRFSLQYNDGNRDVGARLRLSAGKSNGGLVWDYWRQRHPYDPVEANRVFELKLTLDQGASLSSPPELVVGLLFYRVAQDIPVVEWNSDHFFVPPSLNGAGFKARFLDSLIKRFETDYLALHVVFDATTPKRDLGARLSRMHDLNFYKSRGFEYTEPAGDVVRLVRPLKSVAIAKLPSVGAERAATPTSTAAVREAQNLRMTENPS